MTEDNTPKLPAGFKPDSEQKSPELPSGFIPDEVKKKVIAEATPSTSPLVSEGGTSGLTATPSVSVNTPTETYKGIDFEGARTYQVPVKTALGNKSIQYTKPSPFISVKEEAANKKIEQDLQTKLKIDAYDKYKSTRSTENPLALDDNKNTMDFYLHNLKETNPEEYNIITQKQAHLSEKGDKLEEQKFHAELIKKALALKTRVMAGKTDIATNALKDNYGSVIQSLNENSDKATQTEGKIKEIDDFIKQNYQVDENGQIITDATNRKEVEDLINKRNEFVNEYEGYSKSLQDIQQNKDFIDALSLLDETQKSYDSLEQLYKEVREGNPEAFNKLPAYKEQLKKEQEAQFHKDITEQMTGGDLGITEAIGRGATGMLTSLSFIPKSFGNDKDYGWTDKLYDSVKSSVDEFDAENNPLPTGYDKPVYENGQWNLQYLPGKIAGTITEMAPIIAITAATEGATAGLLARMSASGELSTTLGSFAGEYVTVADDFYNDAKEAGMSEKDAMAFSRSAATTQAVLGSLSPDIKLARNNAFKEGIETYAAQVAKGVSTKDAVKEAAKGFSEKLLKEVPQENLQTLAEISDKNNMYEKMGLTDKIQQGVKKDMIETSILSSIVTLGLGAGSVKTPSRMQQESLYMAASQPEEIMGAAKKLLDAGKITQQQFNDATMKVAKANFALSKMDKSLPAEKKIKMLVPLMEKIDLKEEAANLDDSQKELMNEKITKKDAEIKHIATQLSDEELENDKQEADYLNSIKEAHAKEQAAKTAKETIPAEENKMQNEGLFELDQSQKSQPIELSTTPENVITTPGEIVQEPTKETKSNEDKIAELEKAIKDNKQNYFNEKIDHPTYRKNNDALEADLLKLQTPQEKTTENDKENITGVQSSVGTGEKSIEVKPNEETSSEQTASSGVLQAQGQEIKQQEVKTPTQISAAQEMIDEEPVEPTGKDDEGTVKKMNDDAEIIKGFSRENYEGKSDVELKDLISKKYIGSLERAYKAKVDGRISKPTYTEYRNKLNDIVSGKLAEYGKKEKTTGGAEGESLRKGELKAQVSALGEKVKEKLLGQGFKNVALSSVGPISPKMVEDLVNLTVKGVHLGIDLGYSVREATDRALTAIKNHPKYKQIAAIKDFDSKKFRSDVEAEFSKAKSEIPVEKVIEKETQSNKENQQEQQKEENKAGEKTTESNKKEAEVKPEMTSSEFETGETKKRKITERLENKKEYDDIVKSMSEESKNYKTMNLKQLAKAVDAKISEFEKAGKLDELANDLLDIEKAKKFPPETIPYFLSELGDKFNTLADKEQNGYVKSRLENTASKLLSDYAKLGTTTGKTMATMSLVAEKLPTSTSGLKSFVKTRQSQIHDQAMSQNNKQDVDQAVKELVDLQVKQELEKLAQGTMSKERVEKVKGISSLKIDLSEC